jgi:signal transduction histidine kinase
MSVIQSLPMPDFSETFSVDSALLQELGERLVTTPHVALAELVKNSYDADATEVNVIIREGENGGPEIEVSDNGTGMTLAQIKNYWMRIGHTHKGTEEHSEYYGRPLTGSKGIGRFCVRRLGTKVKLEAKAKSGNTVEINNLAIDWTKFIPGEDVAEVPVTGTTEKKRQGQTGVKLVMSGHKSVEWHSLGDQRSYAYLLRQLSTLAANRGTKRTGYKPDPGFRVILQAPTLEYGTALGGLVDEEDPGLAVDIRERLMNAGWALLTARVGKDGKAHCRIDAASPVGTRSYTSIHKFPHLNDVSLKLAMFVEETGWNRDEKLVPLGKLNSILNDWGGVQLRHKGMRIFPYGNPGDDWLDIEKDRARRLGKPPQADLIDFASTLKARTPLDTGRVLLNMLSHKAYLGAIEVGEDQKGLEPKADREGFVENATFREIRQLARYAIDWAMIWRDYAVKERERGRAEKYRRELEKGTGGKPIAPAEQSNVALRILRQGVATLRATQDKNIPVTITKEEIRNLTSAASLIESEIRSNRADLLRFQLVASAATLSLLYHHEVKYLTQTLTTLAADLQEAIESLRGEIKAKCQEVLGIVNTAQESLDTLGDLTQDMGILDRKALAGRLDLAHQAERAIARFMRVASAYNVEITKKIDEGLLVGPMLKGELSAILLNVLSNAIKSVIASGAPKGLIELQAYQSRNKICLDIKDNGIGIKTEERQSVFNPLVSDPSSELYDALEVRLASEDRQLLGQGSGLGLSIVQGILENRKGSVSFNDPIEGWSTCLHIELPKP